jgi:hypothetical protein
VKEQEVDEVLVSADGDAVLVAQGRFYSFQTRPGRGLPSASLFSQAAL